jgi:hypothetical protein
MNRGLVTHPGQLTLAQKKTLREAVAQEREIGLYIPRASSINVARTLASTGFDFLVRSSKGGGCYNVTEAGYAMAVRLVPEGQL